MEISSKNIQHFNQVFVDELQTGEVKDVSASLGTYANAVLRDTVKNDPEIKVSFEFSGQVWDNSDSDLKVFNYGPEGREWEKNGIIDLKTGIRYSYQRICSEPTIVDIDKIKAQCEEYSHGFLVSCEDVRHKWLTNHLAQIYQQIEALGETTYVFQDC